MHEHLFVALTLDRLLQNPAESAQTCLKCFRYAAKAQRSSAFKAIQVIAKRQTKLRLTTRDIQSDPQVQAFRCLHKVIEFGLTAPNSTALTIKNCLSALTQLQA